MISNDERNVCLWCGEDTTKNTDREHIFPEGIGGKRKLPSEYVCKECNQNLSFLDEALKKEHATMMHAFQVDPGIKGKNRGKRDRERKEKEKVEIRGKYSAKDTQIKNHGESTNFVNANFAVFAEYFVRSLHKCAANILCDMHGSSYVRKNYNELLEFVKIGGDVRPWSYAVSYPKLFVRLLITEPQILSQDVIDSNRNKYEAFSFIHTSGIWIVGSSPFLLNAKLIEVFSETILNLPYEHNSKKPISDFFGFTWGHKDREKIGKLNFFWVVKEIEGSPNEEFLHLLTKCKICGQTNPTGITINREIIYKGNRNRSTMYSQNTWNNYTLSDLKKLGFNIEKWNKNDLKHYMKQGLSVPTENDVRKMKIENCYCQCINCGNWINFSAENCFI